MNRQRPLLLFLLIAYIFAPDFFSWVVDPSGGWYRPYLIWLIVIAIAFVIQIRGKTNEH